MDKNRKMPRIGCTYSCVIKNTSNNEALNAYLADISAAGASFCPCSLSDSAKYNIGDELAISVDLSDVAGVNQILIMDAVVRWKRGSLIGFEITFIDEVNFKKWWLLVYKTFFRK